MNAEIEDLQSRLAFQEDLISTLNDQVARQDQAIKALQAQVREINRKLNDVVYQVEAVTPNNSSEKPPHY